MVGLSDRFGYSIYNARIFGCGMYGCCGGVGVDSHSHNIVLLYVHTMRSSIRIVRIVAHNVQLDKYGYVSVPYMGVVPFENIASRSRRTT